MNNCILITVSAASLLCLLKAPTASAGLVAYWDFNETSGTVLPDKVGSTDGTITGAQYVASGAGLPGTDYGNALEFNHIDDVVSPAIPEPATAAPLGLACGSSQHAGNGPVRGTYSAQPSPTHVQYYWRRCRPAFPRDHSDL